MSNEGLENKAKTVGSLEKEITTKRLKLQLFRDDEKQFKLLSEEIGKLKNVKVIPLEDAQKEIQKQWQIMQDEINKGDDRINEIEGVVTQARQLAQEFPLFQYNYDISDEYAKVVFAWLRKIKKLLGVLGKEVSGEESKADFCGEICANCSNKFLDDDLIVGCKVGRYPEDCEKEQKEMKTE